MSLLRIVGQVVPSSDSAEWSCPLLATEACGLEVELPVPTTADPAATSSR